MADGFLGRWSRRKQQVRTGQPLPPEPVVETPPQPAAPVAVAAVAAPAPVVAPEPEQPPPPTMSDVAQLTPEADFSRFVARGVSPEVRNAAVKKLFADPRFNVMDGLDIYIGDYTQPDPLPAGMLRQMASAHAMGFFDDEKKAGGDAGAGGADADAGAIAPEAAQPRDDAEAGGRTDVAQSGVCNAVPSVPTSEPVRVARSEEDGVAPPASHTHDDHDAHLRLQPDDAPQREGVGRGTA